MEKTPIYIATNLTKERACPVCFAKLDGLTCLSLDREHMTDTMALGDVSRCAYCGVFLILTEFGFQVMEDQEFDRIDPVLKRAWTAMPTFKKSTEH